MDYDFRLLSALDNRSSYLEKFEQHVNQIVHVLATPGPYEMERTEAITRRITRPIGLLDPEVEIRPIMGQTDDLVGEIHERIEKDQRMFVTTLTKKTTEDLADCLRELGLKVKYLHSGIKTLEKTGITRSLRLGEFDILTGINLLHEGIDTPEVSLTAVLDADKGGFLHSERLLVQTMGRAAQGVEGKVIIYIDKVTDLV